MADAAAAIPGRLQQRSPIAAATWALFFGFALLMLGNALQGILVGVRSESEGFGVLVSGLIMAAYFAGFLIGSRYALHLLTTVGHIRVFAALASVASAVVLVQALVVVPGVWVGLRFVFGFCMAGIYVVVESWLNDIVGNESRGRILAIYMVVSMGAFGGGQFLLTVADPSGVALFILASVLVSLSLVPISLSAASAPPMNKPKVMTVRDLLDIVPTGLLTSFFVGAAAGTLIGIGPVYAASVNLPTERIALFTAAPSVGAVLAQFPIGWLSDRVPRRGVIFGVSAAAAALCLVLTQVEPGSSVMMILMGVLGGLVFPLYGLSVAYTNDWLPPERIVGASGALIRVNGTGALVGPVVSTLLMSRISNNLFFWALAAAHLVIAAYVAWRIVVLEGLNVDEQRRYQMFPARASVIAARMMPKRRVRGIDLTQRRRFGSDDSDEDGGAESDRS